MAQRIAGIAFLTVDGNQLALRGNFTVSPSPVERTMVAGQDGVHGYALYQRDYRRPRDELIKQLEAEGPGTLQLPTQPAQQVVCPRYRMSEEERFGGYCVFDMTFLEYGLDPQALAPTIATASVIAEASEALRAQVLRAMSAPQLPPTRAISA